MRDQYAGDISDLLKLALLRALVGEHDTLGVGWYYNPANDGRPDGRRREYCAEPQWRSLDSTLWNALRELPQRSVDALERLAIWPAGTRFHRVAVPSSKQRRTWALDMKVALDGCSVVFLDPDNGLGATERHATVHEVETMRLPGRAVVLIKFPTRHNHDRQIEEYHAMLWGQIHCLSLATLRTTVWIKQPTFRWFTVIDADDYLMARAEQFVKALNGIQGSKGDIVRATRTVEPSASEAAPSAAEREGSDHARNVCPECGHRFKGKGFDGIDAHWRARHEEIMPYAQAWPLVKSGNYCRSGLASRRLPAVDAK